MMEDPVNFSLTDSPLFGGPQIAEDSKNVTKNLTTISNANRNSDNDDIDLSGSLLLGGISQPEVLQEDELLEVSYGKHQQKQVKLFSGRTITLKPKTRKQINHEDIKSSEEMDMIDMDLLFLKAKEKQVYKENQRQLDEESMQQENVKPKKKTKPSLIWTEKYRPKRFLQLCSAGNDRQYRLISHWLQRWSGVVFNTEYEYETLMNNNNNNANAIDALGRPYKKILLVTGPPGIGKTATVHLIAKQLGYNVEELNAANSMDTLPSATTTSGGTGGNYGNINTALKLKIKNALTSNSIQSQGNKIISNGKPTCLVIDEIDTAGNLSDIIRVIHDLIQSDQRALNNKNSSHQLNNKNKKKKDNLLNRPIICIANDAYTTSSRTWGGFNMDKLRSISEIVNFQKPGFIKRSSGIKTGGKAINSVKEHIKYISEQENLNLEYKEINEIVELCEGDIRASINHLQFNGRKLENFIGTSDQKENKDLQLSWFNVSDMLFKRDPQLSKEQDFDQLIGIILSSGNSINNSSGTLDKVVKSCFNKYLDHVYYQDDSLNRPCALSDWLDFYDQIGHNNEIQIYSNLLLMKIWQLFSEINPQRITKSLLPDIKTIEFESNELKKQNKAIIKKVISNIPISLKISLGGGFEHNESMGLFILPFLHKLLFPNLSSSGSSSNILQMKLKNTLDDFDKSCLEKSSKLYKDLQIELETFKDHETNQFILETNPNLDSLIFYDNELIRTNVNLKQVQLKRKWYFPMVQAELERIAIQNKNKSVKRSVSPEVIDHNGKPQTKKPKFSNSVDFFKGQYEGISTKIQNTKKVDESSRIWVKYNEGYSNAVRKVIGWNDLWRP